MKINPPFPIKTRQLRGILCAGFIYCTILSCNNYQNPGNNTGKTGDGTPRDSLKAPKDDSGKGANLENKMINEQNDSALKKRQHKLP